MNYHTQSIVDNMLWAIFVHPVAFSTHLKSNRQLMDLGQGVSTTFVSGANVAYQFVEVGKVVKFQRELISKWTSIVNGMHTLLVQSIDIDIRRKRVSLSLCMREPRWRWSRDTWIMDSTTANSKWAVDKMKEKY